MNNSKLNTASSEASSLSAAVDCPLCGDPDCEVCAERAELDARIGELGALLNEANNWFEPLSARCQELERTNARLLDALDIYWALLEDATKALNNLGWHSAYVKYEEDEEAA